MDIANKQMLIICESFADMFRKLADSYKDPEQPKFDGGECREKLPGSLCRNARVGCEMPTERREPTCSKQSMR